MRGRKWLLLGSLFAMVLVVLQSIPSLQVYTDAVRSGQAQYASLGPYNLDGAAIPASAYVTEAMEEPTSLLDYIREEARKRSIPPVNAKIDPVWKAIPGYNGLEVDVEATAKLADPTASPAQLRYVMKETPPAVQLEDLEPQPIYKGNPKKPMVSLMINVAWGNEYLPGMLETLRNEHVHATFFLDGMWLKQNVEMAKTIQAEGHELSNHAYSHKDMRTISRSKAYEEISKTEKLLKEQLGVSNRLFAPPSGYFKQETVDVAHELQLKTVLWTLDTVDWKKPGASWILERISARVEPGSLILMHPTESSSQALEGMIRMIKKKGLTLGTVSELLSPKRVEVPGRQS